MMGVLTGAAALLLLPCCQSLRCRGSPLSHPPTHRHLPVTPPHPASLHPLPAPLPPPAQLRCCGVLEVARIAAAGYPTRHRHAEFAERYRVLLPELAGPGAARVCWVVGVSWG